MDGITLDQLQTALSDTLGLKKDPTLESLERLFTSQRQAIEKLQSYVGQKIDVLTVHQDKANNKLIDLVNFLKKTEDRGVTDRSTKAKDTPGEKTANKTESSKSSGLSEIKLVSSTAASIPSGIKVLPVRIVDEVKSKEKEKEMTDRPTNVSPFHRDEVNILFPAETKVYLENLLGDTVRSILNVIKENNYDLINELRTKKEKKEEKEPLWKKLLAPLLSIGSALGKFLLRIPGMLFDLGKQIIPLISRLLGPLMPLLLGAGALVAGIATLLDGLFDTGPLKGLKKIIGKGALSAGMKILKNQFAKIGKIVAGAAKSMFGEKAFTEFIETIKTKATGFIAKIAKLPGKMLGKATGLLKGIFKGGVFEKVFSKIGGKNIFGTMLSKLGIFFKGALKKVPIIGNLISIGFAYKRFKDGDTIGGIIDTLNALTGLLYLTPAAPLAFPISLGLDILNAFLDIKAGGATSKQQSAKIDIFKGAFNWVYDKIKNAPVIGPLINAGTALFKGDWDGVMKYLGGVIQPLKSVYDFVVSAASAAAPVVESATLAVGNFAADAGKWLYEKAKNIPVVGSLIKAGEALFNGNWDNVVAYLGEAIEPLQYIGGLILEGAGIAGSAVASVASNVGDIIGNVGAWLYEKAKNIPVIGSLLKAGEAIGSGKWDDVLGYLGEAISPLQYIGGLIASGAKAVAVDASAGVTSFFSSLKDSLFKAVLDMIPDIKVGSWSLKSSVAKLLGVSATSTASSLPAAMTPASTSLQVPSSTSTVNQLTTSTQFPNVVENNESITASQPKWSKQVATVENTTPATEKADNSSRLDSANLSGIHSSLKQHTAFMKGMIEYQKQTVAHTKQLIDVIQKLEGSKTVNVSTVNSPTAFISAPMTSTSLRQSMLEAR